MNKEHNHGVFCHDYAIYAMNNCTTGDWRENDKGPMQVVSGAMGKQNVHFEAPPSVEVEGHMGLLLDWINPPSDNDILYQLIIKMPH